MDAQDGKRVVRLTRAAEFDLATIDNATAATWGVVQAEHYLEFLQESFSLLLDDPRLGSIIDQFEGCRVYVAKYTGRWSSHGHRIFYRETEFGIRIIRILHTAMNWTDHLEDFE